MVMMSEVLIFVPSVARFRVEWLNERLENAHLAMLVLEASPDPTVGDMLKAELLSRIGAHAMTVRRGGARIVLRGDNPPLVAESFNLTGQGFWRQMFDAIDVYGQSGNRVIQVLAQVPDDPDIVIELVLDEAPLRAEMIGFGWRIFLLSVVIATITSTMVFLALRWFMVRPMARITRAMVDFSENPEDRRRIIAPSGRRDEIGTAERELEGMQRALRAALAQKAHLAALGAAVARINHDLRGILSSAMVVSDMLETVDDPKVQRLTPTLLKSIERASALCSQTLDYVGRDQPETKRARFALHPIVHDIKTVEEAGGDDSVVLDNHVIDAFQVFGDRDQIFRILNNLVRNAAQAGAKRTTVTARRNGNSAEIDVIDDGPGLPKRARDNLFKPFEGSARAGGTGLGLAIAREMARGHGGDLVLVSTGAQGTVFRIRLPMDTPVHGSVT